MNANGAIKNRRSDPRHPVKGDVRAFFGCIEGEILDISRGGLCVRFKADDLIPGGSEEIFMAVDMESGEFYLTGIQVKEVTHCILEDELSAGGPKTKRCGIIFGDLRPLQLFRIDYLLWLADINR